MLGHRLGHPEGRHRRAVALRLDAAGGVLRRWQALVVQIGAGELGLPAPDETGTTFEENATLKALGFGPRFVYGLIYGESLVIALVGGAVGVLLTFPLADAFFSATRDLFVVFQVMPQTVALQVGSAVLIGVVAAIAPAINSARVRIVDGLRAVT